MRMCAYTLTDTPKASSALQFGVIQEKKVEFIVAKMARQPLKTINWGALAERIRDSEKPILASFKAKSDQFLRRVQQYPETAPKIDWSYYKGQVAVAGMVDSFQKQYESLSIPYPKDTYTEQIDAKAKEEVEKIKRFVTESNACIAAHQAEMDRINGLLPFDQMTMEDFKDAYPDQALDPVNNPTVWPHREEDQVDRQPEPH